MEDLDSRDVIIQQKLYQVNMADNDTATRITVRMKEHPIKTIIDTEANVSIVIYPIIKRLQLAMRSTDDSQIIAVNQQRKTVKVVVREVSLAIADVKVPITLLVIDALEPNLLLGTDWMRRYDAELFFRKKNFTFEAKGQKIVISLEFNQLRFASPNHAPEEYKVNMTQIDET